MYKATNQPNTSPKLVAPAGACDCHTLFLACGRILMSAEAFALHRRDLARRLEEYGEIADRRFAIGATVSAADLLDTLALKADLTKAVDRILDSVDVLVTAISLSVEPLQRYRTPCGRGTHRPCAQWHAAVGANRGSIF